MALNIPSIPSEWGTDLTPARLIGKLESSTLTEIINFAESSEEARRFVLQNKASLMDLNPFSMLLEDFFADDETDNLYSFNIYVRNGHDNGTARNEEVLHAETLDKFWSILEFFNPDIVDIKMVYAYQYEAQLEKLIGRKLEIDEIGQLKQYGQYALMQRRRHRLTMYLAKHNFAGSDFQTAKEHILHTGTSGDMPIDVYDVAIAMEQDINMLALNLNLNRFSSPKLNTISDHVRLLCNNANVENDLC